MPRENLFGGDYPGPVTDGGQPGDRDLHSRPPVPSAGWRWWLDDSGQRNAAFYVSRWLVCEGAPASAAAVWWTVYGLLVWAARMESMG